MSPLAGAAEGRSVVHVGTAPDSDVTFWIFQPAGNPGPATPLLSAMSVPMPIAAEVRVCLPAFLIKTSKYVTLPGLTAVGWTK